MFNKSGAETSVIFACDYLYQRLFYSLGLLLLSTKLNIDMCVKSLLFRLKVMASSVEGSIA
jgi:hypothetical protein